MPPTLRTGDASFSRSTPNLLRRSRRIGCPTPNQRHRTMPTSGSASLTNSQTRAGLTFGESGSSDRAGPGSASSPAPGRRRTCRRPRCCCRGTSRGRGGPGSSCRGRPQASGARPSVIRRGRCGSVATAHRVPDGEASPRGHRAARRSNQFRGCRARPRLPRSSTGYPACASASSSATAPSRCRCNWALPASALQNGLRYTRPGQRLHAVVSRDAVLAAWICGTGAGEDRR